MGAASTYANPSRRSVRVNPHGFPAGENRAVLAGSLHGTYRRMPGAYVKDIAWMREAISSTCWELAVSVRRSLTEAAPKPPWSQHKRSYVRHVHAPRSVGRAARSQPHRRVTSWDKGDKTGDNWPQSGPQHWPPDKRKKPCSIKAFISGGPSRLRTWDLMLIKHAL